jgi:hypothetical protein
MFADRYRAAFEELGRPLTPTDAMTALDIATMETDEFRLPLALYEYYLVAGKEQVLNHSFNDLLDPADVFVESGRICFMEATQASVYWGVPGAWSDENPPLEQGVCIEDEIEWHREDTDCAGFLETMLYWQASFGGGLSSCGSAWVSRETRLQLERDFRFVGSIGLLNAYGRNGCALSFLEWFNAEEGRSGWKIFAGFTSEELRIAVGKALNLEWDAE